MGNGTKNKSSIKYQKVVERLKGKYEMDFDKFEEKLGKKFDLTWEHEKDYIDWDWALTNIKNR
ncbi:MAG: hypothetical protein V1833_01850 [Elusimicrobiota bacterium]